MEPGPGLAGAVEPGPVPARRWLAGRERAGNEEEEEEEEAVPHVLSISRLPSC